MHQFKLAVISSASVLVFVLSASEASAENDACKVLTVEKFSEIMGYKAKVNVSTKAMCIYGGTGDAGGILMIISEDATPQQIARVDSDGATLRGEPGKLGATFRKGKVVFSVGINGTDPSRVKALASEVIRNLR